MPKLKPHIQAKLCPFPSNRLLSKQNFISQVKWQQKRLLLTTFHLNFHTETGIHSTGFVFLKLEGRVGVRPLISRSECTHTIGTFVGQRFGN